MQRSHPQGREQFLLSRLWAPFPLIIGKTILRGSIRFGCFCLAHEVLFSTRRLGIATESLFGHFIGK